MSKQKILCLGDVVGPGAVAHLQKHLWKFRSTAGADLVICNCENAARGNGVDIASADALLNSGADILTSGNHIWKQREIKEYLDRTDRLLRPANYPAACPGSGYTVLSINGWRYLIINVMGVIYLDPLEAPISCIERILRRMEGAYDFAILDFHAEATSEKVAVSRYFDGKLHIVVGTHTHVPTDDIRILRGGTGCITDLGMTGPDESVLGVREDCIFEKLRYHMPVRFDIADGAVTANGALFTLDTDSRRVTEALRVSF